MAASVVPTSTSVQVADNAKEDSVADRTDVNGKENVVLTSVKATEFSMAGAELQSSEQLQETGFLAIKNGLPSVDQHGVSYVPYESERQLPDIMELMKSDLSEPYSIYTFRYFIHQWPKLCILARFDGDCVGAIVCKLDFHRSMIRRGYIAMLAVHRNHRRKHIGSSLVKRVIGQMMADGCDEVVLEADVSNEAALSLYANLGFVRDKYLHRYYLNGADAYRLKLWLTDASLD